MNIDEKIAMLTSSDNKQAYNALKDLIAISEENNRVYYYFDKFVEMMNDKSNSYIRTRGLRLIAFNSKWDKKNKVNLIIEEYLKHIEDEKPITSRQCIKNIVIIAKNKPELIQTILVELEKFDRIYEDSMQSLIYKDRKKAIRQIRQFIW